MAYIDRAYFASRFPDASIDPAAFARLAQIASDLIDLLVYRPVPLVDGTAPEEVRIACGYEVECLDANGGVDAVYAPPISSERVGDYDVTLRAEDRAMLSVGGIPISPLCYGWLVKSGLMCRAIHSERR